MRIDYSASARYKEQKAAESESLWQKAATMTPNEMERWLRDNLVNADGTINADVLVDVLVAMGKKDMALIRTLSEAGLWGE